MKIKQTIIPLWFIVLFFTMSVTNVFACAQHAHADTGKERAVLQASDTTPVEDDRIGSLWLATGTDTLGVTASTHRACTASYLGSNFWITAHHCVAGNLHPVGYIEQTDGQAAGIEDVYTLSNEDDVALIKVGDGIDADKFALPERNLEVNDVATLIGYGGSHSYSSIATTHITKHLTKLNFGSAVYTDLVEARTATDSRSCSGDSGGPIFIDDTIYAVHTGGEDNPACLDGKGGLMWHTTIYPRRAWITTIIVANANSTNTQREHARLGLATRPQPTPNPPTNPGLSLTLSSLSSTLSSIESN